MTKIIEKKIDKKLISLKLSNEILDKLNSIRDELKEQGYILNRTKLIETLLEEYIEKYEESKKQPSLFED